MMHRKCGVALLVFLVACGGRQSTPAPNVNTRSDYYALIIQSARLAHPGLSLQLISDSVTTVLDSAVLNGIDDTYKTWRKLTTEGQVKGAARTVIGSQEFGDTLVRDYGRILFERIGMKDTTMAFSSLWRREKAGWRLYRDSIRAER